MLTFSEHRAHRPFVKLTDPVGRLLVYGPARSREIRILNETPCHCAHPKKAAGLKNPRPWMRKYHSHYAAFAR